MQYNNYVIIDKLVENIRYEDCSKSNDNSGSELNLYAKDGESQGRVQTFFWGKFQ